MESMVMVANPTATTLEVVFRLAFSTGRTRADRVTVAPGETFSAKVGNLFGSQRSEPSTTLTGLTVTCGAGAVACPVTWVSLVPGCAAP